MANYDIQPSCKFWATPSMLEVSLISDFSYDILLPGLALFKREKASARASSDRYFFFLVAH